MVRRIWEYKVRGNYVAFEKFIFLQVLIFILSKRARYHVGKTVNTNSDIRDVLTSLMRGFTVWGEA